MTHGRSFVVCWWLTFLLAWSTNVVDFVLRHSRVSAFRLESVSWEPRRRLIQSRPFLSNNPFFVSSPPKRSETTLLRWEESPPNQQPKGREESWKSKYEELYNFYKNHGHTNLPQGAEYKDLRAWMTYQRIRYRHARNVKAAPLTPKQIQSLEEIQFSWTPHDEIWWNNFSELESFYQTHGHFNIKGRENSKLRRWKNSLRRLCREYVLAVTIEGTAEGVHVSGLNEERIEALRRVRFCWLPPPWTKGPWTQPPPDDIFDGYP